MLLAKLCLYLHQNWHSSLPSNTTSCEVFHGIRCLLKGRYTFSPMGWSAIRNPTKPDKLWPIGALEAVIVEAMGRLLSLEMESIYLRYSREFGVARGARSFFASVSRWPEMDWMVKCSIVECSSGIDHHLLGNFLRKHLGEENSGFVELVMRFLVRGKKYRCKSIGLPQGSSISQVLMTFYLHQLDKIFLEEWDIYQEEEQPVRVYYARYAETILLGIPRITKFENAARAKEHARSILKNACAKLDLDVCWEEISPNKLIILLGGQKMLEVLGLVVSFKDSGRIKVSFPLKMWRQRVSTGRLVQEFRDGLNRLTMANFLRLLNEHVEAYLRTAFQYPISQKKVVPLFRFFLRLVISRCRNFVRQTGCEESGVPGLNISQVQENYVATLVEKFQRIEMEKIKEVLASREGKTESTSRPAGQRNRKC